MRAVPCGAHPGPPGPSQEVPLNTSGRPALPSVARSLGPYLRVLLELLRPSVRSRPLRLGPPRAPLGLLRSGPRLPARAVNLVRLLTAAAALGGAATTGWAVFSVRRRPRGHDVVTSMSYREARPGPGTRPAGTPVVLVHGLGMSGRSLDRMVVALGRTTRALAPDLPGYGRSHQPRVGMLGVDGLARSLLGWMDEQGVDRAVLVGHSLGAQVAGELALLAPERVSRLVLVAPTGDPERPSVLRQALRLARGVLDESPLLVAVAAVDYLRAGPGQMVMLMRRAVQRASRRLDVTVEAPVLVVRGSEDRVCSQRWCERLVSEVVGGRLVVVPDAAHGVAFDAPPELVRLVEAEVRAADAAAVAVRA